MTGNDFCFGEKYSNWVFLFDVFFLILQINLLQMNAKQPITKLYFKIGNKEGYTFWDSSRLIKIKYLKSQTSTIALD